MSALFACAATNSFDAERYRRDFPALQQQVNGRPLVYLDNGASAQKPKQVIEALSHFYERDYANVHRGVHTLSQRATDRYEAARKRVAAFINARENEIVFTRGATEAINLLASSWGRVNLKAGDEVLVTELEHHANIVPWQLLESAGVVLKVARIEDDGSVPLQNVIDAMTPRTRLVAVAHISNVLGTVLPVAEIIKAAHARGVPVLVDGCQAAPHMALDMRALDADFYVFSSHKLFGPTGIGVLYGKAALLAVMPPYQGGGDMIESVSFSGSTFAAAPQRFEAGTPAIAQAVGLAAAMDYVSAVGLDAIAAYEHELLDTATVELEKIPGLTIIGTARPKAAIVSFRMENAHPHDIGTILDQAGVAIRTGNHCAEPLMARLGLPGGTARASFAFYNTRADVDALVSALHKVREIFS